MVAPPLQCSMHLSSYRSDEYIGVKIAYHRCMSLILNNSRSYTDLSIKKHSQNSGIIASVFYTLKRNKLL